MGSREERLRILKMIQEAKISAEEGAKLLDAIESARERERTAVAGTATGSKWFRIRVTDLQTGRRKIDVNIPMSLVNIGARIGARLAASVDVDLDTILQAVESGAEGKILDVEDAEDGEHVEIYVE